MIQCEFPFILGRQVAQNQGKKTDIVAELEKTERKETKL